MTKKHNIAFNFAFLLLLFNFYSPMGQARDLAEIKEEGVLRHIGIPYANFVTVYRLGNENIAGGFDVELMRGFAHYLELEYQYVPAKWSTAFALLTGRSAQYIDNKLVKGKILHAIQGDVIANGATILPWREEVVDFSDAYFPSAVWLVSRADSDLTPIKPSGSISVDISQVKAMLNGRDVLAMKQSCLDPDLYNLQATQANIIFPSHERKLNEMVPAILNNDAESTLLDVPDTLVALQKWPGEIKVIGPISDTQTMGVAFRKDSPILRAAFNRYLYSLKQSGKYNPLIKKYYPSVFDFYAEFFTMENKIK